MRQISLNARLAHEAEGSDEIEVALIQITHPETNQTVRLSSDPTELITRAAVLPGGTGRTTPIYGTRSTWLDADPRDDAQVFQFVLLSVVLPDDQQDTAPVGRFAIEGVDNTIAEVLRSTTRRADVSMAVVLASSPDLIEQEWTGLRLLSVEGQGSQITLSVSRAPVTSEPWPSGRMTRERFPGLHA